METRPTITAIALPAGRADSRYKSVNFGVERHRDRHRRRRVMLDTSHAADSKVDNPGSWYKCVNFGAKTGNLATEAASNAGYLSCGRFKS